MCDEAKPNLDNLPYTDLSRRQFAGLAAAGAAMGMAGAAHAQAAEVVERDVNVRTPDGVSDSVVFYPAGGGRHPGVLFWTDIGGLRPAKRDMGRRLAAQGYVVLVVNPFYRTVTAEQYRALDNQVPADAAKRTAARAANTPEAIGRDAVAFVRYLDALPQTSAAKVGVQGYCMGGPLSFLTAAAAPNRIGAVGTFHSGALVTDQPTSLHLLIPKTNARYLVATAKNDDANRPAEKGALREAFYQAGKSAIVEVFEGNHGWCVPDSAQYHQAEAERAWAMLLDVYKRSLV
jgi:carboxymethylenebutenolidase